MKESITNFDLNAAFKQLNDIQTPKAKKGIAANRPAKLTETYNRGDLKTDLLIEEYLTEDAYNVSDTADLEDAQENRDAEVAEAKLARIEKIVDLDAKTADELAPSYVGKVIVQCPQCLTMFYKDPEDIEPSEDDPATVNVNETCQHCGNTSGYTLIGKIDAAEETPAEGEVETDLEDTELDLDNLETDEEAENTDLDEIESDEDNLDLDLDNLDLDTEENEEEEEPKEESFKTSSNAATLNEDFEDEEEFYLNDSAQRANLRNSIKNYSDLRDDFSSEADFDSFDNLEYDDNFYDVFEDDYSDSNFVEEDLENENSKKTIEIEDITEECKDCEECDLQEVEDTYGKDSKELAAAKSRRGLTEDFASEVEAMDDEEAFDMLVANQGNDLPETTDEFNQIADNYAEVEEEAIEDEMEEDFDEMVNDVEEAPLEEAVSNALKSRFRTVEAFKLTDCKSSDSELVLEGLATLANGGTRKIKLAFSEGLAKGNKLTLTGLTESLGVGQVNITLEGNVIDKKLITENFNYSFTSNGKLVESIQK